MSLNTDLRDAAAKVLLDTITGTIGETITYSQKGATAITGLSAVVGQSNKALADVGDGIMAEVEERTFEIPRQTGSAAFPPSGGPNNEDVIDYDSKSFIITGVAADQLGVVWTLQGRALLAHKMGMV